MDGSTITVAQLDAHLKAMAELEVKIDAQAEVTKALNKEYAQMEGRAAQYLKDLEREDYSGPYGKVAIDRKWRVNMPADDNAKRALFDHLRERQIFDKFATVNSNSLNALYMRDWAEAKEKGMGIEFQMPGIESPKLFETVKFKATK